MKRKAGSNHHGRRMRNDLSGREMLSQLKEPQSQAVELESLSHGLLQQLPSLLHVDCEKHLQQTFSNHKKHAIMRLFN